MNLKKKKLFFIVFLSLAVFILIVTRIFYINTCKYPLLPEKIYKLNDNIDYSGFNICVSEYKLYNQEELSELISYDIGEFGEEFEIILTMHIKNAQTDFKYINPSVFSLEYGDIPGGGINPVLFNILNPDFKKKLNSGEEITIFLPYPIIDENPHLILSLYPQKIIIEI